MNGKGALRALVYALVVCCCIFTAFNLIRLNRRPHASPIPSEEINYDRPIPDLIFSSLGDKEIELSQLTQRVLIVKFTNFFDNEINYLIYLDYLAQRYKDKLSLLFFYNSSRDAGTHYIYRHSVFAAPVVRADERIRRAFNARGNETIILDYEQRIKFMSSANSKRILHSQVRKYACIEDNQPRLPDGGLIYLDLYQKEARRVQSSDEHEYLIVSLCISPCTECSDAKRNDMLKSLLLKHRENLEIFFLFGADNNPAFLEEYKEKYQLFDPNIHIGLLTRAEDHQEADYYRVFNYQIDPCLFVINGGDKLIFMEDEESTSRIDFNFLSELMK